MVSAKLYTTNEEISSIAKELESKYSYSMDQQADSLICIALDSGNQKKLYFICYNTDSGLWIQNVNKSNDADYLLDVCIRMVLHHFFNLGRDEVIFNFDTEKISLENICRKIGFTFVKKDNLSTKVSITNNHFYKNKC